MSEMADMALDYASATESLAYDYTSGDMSMEDAYESGFIDERGAECPEMQSVLGNISIGSLETLNQELATLELQLDVAMLRQQVEGAMGLPDHMLGNNRNTLNEEAIKALTNDVPTCNICRNSMKTQEGKYGKFYFCRCEGQPTVSDKYWQSIKL